MQPHLVQRCNDGSLADGRWYIAGRFLTSRRYWRECPASPSLFHVKHSLRYRLRGGVPASGAWRGADMRCPPGPPIPSNPAEQPAPPVTPGDAPGGGETARVTERRMKRRRAAPGTRPYPTGGTTMSEGRLVSSAVGSDVLACLQPERDAEQRASALRRLGLAGATSGMAWGCVAAGCDVDDPGTPCCSGRGAMFHVKHDVSVVRCRNIAWNHAPSRCLSRRVGDAVARLRTTRTPQHRTHARRSRLRGGAGAMHAYPEGGFLGG